MYYLYLDSFVKNHIFKYPTLKLTHWPLENGLFNQQNSSRNRLFRCYQKDVLHVFCYLFLLKIVFFFIFDLGIDIFMTLN